MNTILQSNRALDRILASLGDLPTSPAIVTSLMGQTTNSDADLEAISKTIMADQSLTARLLKLSNSSFYGRSQKVGTLREAIIILGFKTLRSLVLAASTHSLYQKSKAGDITEKLWAHSLATAIACRLIARRKRHPQAEEAFIAGLMHDIGKLVMIEKIPDEYLDIIKAVERTGAKFVDEEQRRLSFSHTDVALLLLNKWSFPEFLTRAVFRHHDPDNLNRQPAPLAVIVNLANYLAKNLDIGFKDDRMRDPSLLPTAAALGLDADQISEIQEEMAGQFESERELYRGQP